MKENPYSKLLEITKGKNKVIDRATDNVRIGEVVSASPLKITIGDLPIDRDNVLVSDYLLEEYKRDYKTNRYIPNGSDSGTMVFTDGIKVGDQLAILQTADKQLYIIIARVRGV
ncbi:DUF2577 family protein [Sporosarcina sp. P17b]|uniref:DUF2577 family protein n=1 Tax=Sporosarcina sp. P17b TaxID=2048260 RepID=UPI001304364C|nr:DUF2577 family protein [Sporosarcina sp. P17b]